MLKNTLFSTLIFLFISDGFSFPCGGRFPNPITDICWSCMFPMEIGPVKLNPSLEPTNFDPPPLPVCACGNPIPRIGVGFSFWEPARIAEVVRTPMCSPTLNGAILGTLPVPAGTHGNSKETGSLAFYHVHWLKFPVMNWLGTALSNSLCFTHETFDVAYMSELDPLWDDDEVSFVLNPEAILFANPIAQAACIADSAKAIATGFGIDALYWCSGTQGSLFPLSGSHSGHVGGIDSSLAIAHKMIFKLHRQLLAQDTSTTLAMCGALPQPIMRKNQYKQQMMYPIPQNLRGYGFGAPSTLWGAGREFPYKGEDFSYLIWRKRKCCAL